MSPTPSRTRQKRSKPSPLRESKGAATLSADQAAARDRAALAAALDPIITIDPRGMILSASDSVGPLLGWKSGDLLGRNVSILMPEPHRSAHDGYLMRYAHTGKTNIMGKPRQFTAVRRDGTPIPIELCVSRAEVSPDSEPLFVGIIRDLSEQVRLAAALDEQHRSYRALIEHMPDIVFRIDRSFRYLFIGGAVDRISRLTPDQFIGKSGRDLGFPKPAANLFEAACRKVFSTGTAGELDLEFSGAWIHFRLQPEFGPDGAIATIVGVAEEITERRRIEEELARHKQDLERLVQARTEELQRSYRQAYVAERLASIGTLAAGLGHDMNNVLLPVRARLNALLAAAKEHRIPGGEHKHIAEIRKSVAYLQQLADGLHFLALDPDTPEDSRGGGAATDLHQWWRQAGALLSQAVPKHVRVQASIPTDLPRIAVAAHGLTQAVLNLIVNAGEAIPGPSQRKRRQGTIRVWAAAVQESGSSRVRLGVTDNGTGMSADVQRRAFEMFYTTKPRGLGTGLGLALVRKIVERAGGKVEIESELGKGTTVMMTFPPEPTAAISQPEHQRHSAVISITDGRAAALIRHVLEVSGTPVRADGKHDLAETWVVDPAAAVLPAARAWRSAHPRGRLILFGPPPSRSAASWRALKPVTISTPDDFESVRAALGQSATAG